MNEENGLECVQQVFPPSKKKMRILPMGNGIHARQLMAMKYIRSVAEIMRMALNVTVSQSIAID